MKARIVERSGKLYIETQLESLGNQHTWSVLLKDDNDHEPLEITQEKRDIAEIMVDAINGEILM